MLRVDRVDVSYGPEPALVDVALEVAGGEVDLLRVVREVRDEGVAVARVLLADDAVRRAHLGS